MNKMMVFGTWESTCLLTSASVHQLSNQMSVSAADSIAVDCTSHPVLSAAYADMCNQPVSQAKSSTQMTGSPA